MKRLDLPADAAENPKPGYLHQVAAWMLYPQDQGLRERYCEALGAEWVADHLEEPVPVKVARWLYRSPRPQDFDIEQPFNAGMDAGTVLCREIGFDHIDPESTGLQKQKQAVAEALGQDRGTNIKTVHRHWRQVGPVVHFWAAYMDMKARQARRQGRAFVNAFPCAVNELGNFLAIARHYQEQGLAITPKYAKAPLLDAAELVEMPAELIGRIPPYGYPAR